MGPSGARVAAAAFVHSLCLCAHLEAGVGARLSQSALASALRVCMKLLCKRDSKERAIRQIAVRAKLSLALS